MMINKRLIETNKESKKYIYLNVLIQWVSLISNIVIMTSLTSMISSIYFKENVNYTVYFSLILVGIIVRFICSIVSSKMSYYSSSSIKKYLRHMVYEKILKLGSNYKNEVNTSEIIQISTEGIEQLETYFSAYLPQFFNSMIAPLTLFIYISTIDFFSGFVLFICVPLIPVSIIVVQKWAKNLLSKYWNQYTELGDSFLENLQGLTTLKIYQSDEYKNDEMNKEAEKFRKITMKVLTMQLNSITIMDLVAYGGAALGIIVSVTQLQNGVISLSSCLLIILLAADFFIPLRLLGSFFHIAMNGMAASDKMFKLLDLKESEKGSKTCLDNFSIQFDHVDFSYGDKQVLHDVCIDVKANSLVSIVGESGSGKSTITSILMKKNKDYKGLIKFGGLELSDIDENSLFEKITYISNCSYLFKGTIKENLLIANSKADEKMMIAVLKRVKLYDFVMAQNGLDTLVLEQASNLSGGQRQRLALARALIKDSLVYIFDEATSNIDVESEEIIMEEIYKLSKTKTVLLISHRLVNVVYSDNIYVLEKGKVIESGDHNALLNKNSVYANLWNTQYKLEHLESEAAYEKILVELVLWQS